MLGKRINDPLLVESRETTVEGLGLLDVETTFLANKTTTQVRAHVVAGKGIFAGLKGIEVGGYEIHMGQTEGHDSEGPFRVFETPQGGSNYVDGSASDDCLIFGSYIHGLFHNAAFTTAVRPDMRIGWPAVRGPVPQPGNTTLTEADRVWFAGTPDADRWIKTQK